jgi:hypothetical protein
VQQDTVIVIGSQSVLGTWTDDELPEEATRSEEVDIAPLHDDDGQSLATLLDGVAGELSPFHQTHGFYIQGVGRDTAILPDGWEERLVRVSNDNTNGRTGRCLDAVDLCIAKLAAQRQKDSTFVAALLDHGLVNLAELHARADELNKADPENTEGRRRLARRTAFRTSLTAVYPPTAAWPQSERPLVPMPRRAARPIRRAWFRWVGLRALLARRPGQANPAPFRLERRWALPASLP